MIPEPLWHLLCYFKDDIKSGVSPNRDRIISPKWKCAICAWVKNDKTSISMISSISENVADPHKPIILDFGSTICDFESTELLKLDRENSKACWWILFSKIENMATRIVLEGRAPGKPWDPSDRIFKIFNTGSISSKQHDLGILIFQLT